MHCKRLCNILFNEFTCSEMCTAIKVRSDRNEELCIMSVLRKWCTVSNVKISISILIFYELGNYLLINKKPFFSYVLSIVSFISISSNDLIFIGVHSWILGGSAFKQIDFSYKSMMAFQSHVYKKSSIRLRILKFYTYAEYKEIHERKQPNFNIKINSNESNINKINHKSLKNKEKKSKATNWFTKKSKLYVKYKNEYFAYLIEKMECLFTHNWSVSFSIFFTKFIRMVVFFPSLSLLSYVQWNVCCVSALQEGEYVDN